MNLITFYEDTYATSPVLVLVQYKTYYSIIYVMCQVRHISDLESTGFHQTTSHVLVGVVGAAPTTPLGKDFTGPRVC